MRRGHPKFDIFLLRGAFRRVSFSQRLPRQQSFHRFEGFLCFLRVSVFEQMSFVRVDRVEDVRVRFHRFPQLLGKSTGELVEVEERFLVRRGAFERRCVRGATKHIPCVWYFLYPLLQLFVVEKRSKVFVRAFWFSAFGLFSGHTKEMYYWTLFFSAKRKKKEDQKRAKNCSLVLSSQKLGLVARILWTSTPTTTTREDLRVSDPGASRSSRFVSLDFLRLEARALRKDALPRAVVLKCARFVVGFQREEKK